MAATLPLHVESVGGGEPLVLLHGWGLHSGFFAPVLGRLAQRSRVHALDLPGHGLSPPLVPYTLDTVVDAIVATLAGIDAPLTLLGWSFGGIIAQRLAARHPARVARLVLVCTTPRLTKAVDWPFGVDAAVLQRFGDELAVAYEVTLKRFLSLQMRSAHDGRAVRSAMRALLFARGKPDPGALGAGLAILLGTDLRAAAPTLTQPALVITGEHDALTPAAGGAWLANTLPAARLAAIADAAHIPFLSHPDVFMRALDPFLDERALA